MRTLLIFVVAVLSAAQGNGQALNEAFLKSTVLVTYQTEGGQSFGSGFLLFRPIQGDQGHVFLVTNKHVLPPNDRPRTLTIRVNVKSPTDPEVKNIGVPIVSEVGKYAPIVRLHPTAAYDVAAVNITE
jgi:hypothetical protein